MSGSSRVIGMNGGKEITVLDAVRTQLSTINLLYFDYFINATDPSIEDFTDMCVQSVRRMCDALDSRFADHVEGTRNYLNKQKDNDA